MQHLIRNPEHLLFASVLSVISVSSYQCLEESLHFPRRNTGEEYMCVYTTSSKHEPSHLRYCLRPVD